MPLDAYIYDGLRTPIGRHAGGSRAVRPDDLLAGVIKEVVGRNALRRRQRSRTSLIGCANQAGEDSRNVARHAALLAACRSRRRAAPSTACAAAASPPMVDAARGDHLRRGRLFIAGGVESMSRAPFVMGKAESAFSRDTRIFDSTIGARFPNPKVEQAVRRDTMPETADNVAARPSVSRARTATIRRSRRSRNTPSAKADGFFTARSCRSTRAGRGRAASSVPRTSTRAPDTT